MGLRELLSVFNYIFCVVELELNYTRSGVACKTSSTVKSFFKCGLSVR